MAQLVFIDGPRMGTAVPLTGTTTIGRAGTNAVRLPENGILDLHASLAFRDGVWHIARSDPRARVAVNGRETAETNLRHGDILELGSVTVLFSDESTRHGAPAAVPKGPAATESPASPPTTVESRIKQFTNPADVLAAFKKSNRLSKDLETIFRVSSSLGGTLNLEDLLKALNGILFEVFHADRVFILLADELGHLRVASRRFSERSALSGHQQVSWTIINEAVQHREGILTLDASADERFKLGESIVDQSIQSALCVPVVKQDHVIGAIHLDSLTSMAPFTREDLSLLGAIAAQFALAVDSALIYDKQVEYSRKLIQLGETSRRISSFLSREQICREAVEAAARIFDAERVSLLLADENGDLAMAHSLHIPRAEWPRVRLARGERLAGRPFQDGKPMLATEAKTLGVPPLRAYETASFLLVPILATREGLRRESQAIGVLCVTDKRSRRIFDANDQEFMTIFAAQVGITLQNAILFEKSTVDTLTRLFTRQFFFARLEEEVASHRAQKAPLSVMMLDLDHFKLKNDQYGHAAGDVVLREVAGVCKAKVLSAGGVIARFGGEEFVAYLPGTPEKRAADLAEAIRAEVEKKPILYDGIPLPCTVSIGVAQCWEEEDAHHVVKRADAALYSAKRAGRNRVEVEREGVTASRMLKPPTAPA